MESFTRLTWFICSCLKQLFSSSWKLFFVLKSSYTNYLFEAFPIYDFLCFIICYSFMLYIEFLRKSYQDNTPSPTHQGFSFFSYHISIFHFSIETTLPKAISNPVMQKIITFHYSRIRMNVAKEDC